MKNFYFSTRYSPFLSVLFRPDIMTYLILVLFLVTTKFYRKYYYLSR